MKFRKQKVILETMEGICLDSSMLKEVWEERLKMLGCEYYKVIKAEVRGVK